MLGVTRDLFLKGSPEWRVAKYASERRFTEQQLRNFLNKLNFLPSRVSDKIMMNFREMNEGDCFDDSINIGKLLDEWLIAQKNIEITDA